MKNTGFVYCPNATGQHLGEQYGSGCEELRKQGEVKGRSVFAALVQMRVKSCPGIELLH